MRYVTRPRQLGLQEFYVCGCDEEQLWTKTVFQDARTPPRQVVDMLRLARDMLILRGMVRGRHGEDESR